MTDRWVNETTDTESEKTYLMSTFPNNYEVSHVYICFAHMQYRHVFAHMLFWHFICSE